MRTPRDPALDVQTEDLRLFVRCLAEGSLSAGARTLGITQAVASRRIQRLEAAVGTPVLHRTTRSLRPTRDGERLLAAARTMLAELSAFESASRATRGQPAGEVRVSAPILLGQAVGSTLAVTLRRRHPDLRLVLSLANAPVDLVRDNVDVALRVGTLPSTSLRATRIATAHIGAYGRRDRFGKAARPADLVAAPWVGLPRATRSSAARVPAGRASPPPSIPCLSATTASSCGTPPPPGSA